MFGLRICELGTNTSIYTGKFLNCIMIQRSLIRSGFPPVPEERADALHEKLRTSLGDRPHITCYRKTAKQNCICKFLFKCFQF